MTNLLSIFKAKKFTIIQDTLDMIPNALRGDRVNRSFYLTPEGEVDYSVYTGQIIFQKPVFFTILDHETPDAGDYGYDSDDDMLEDAAFIEDHYIDQVEDAVGECIRMLELELINSLDFTREQYEEKRQYDTDLLSFSEFIDNIIEGGGSLEDYIYIANDAFEKL